MKEHQVIKAKRCSAWSEGAFDREKELLLNIGRHCCLWHLQSPLACSPLLPIYNGDSFHNGHSPVRRRDCKLEIGKYLNWWRDDSSRRCRVIILGSIVGAWPVRDKISSHLFFRNSLTPLARRGWDCPPANHPTKPPSHNTKSFHKCKNDFPTYQNNFPTCQNNCPSCQNNFSLSIKTSDVDSQGP